MKEEMNEHIDVKALLGKLWAHKLVFILAWVGTAIVVGAGSFLLPRKWQSSVKMVPEYNLQESLALQELFQEMGTELRIGESGDAFAPASYGDVISDADFLHTLAAQTVTDQSGVAHTVASCYPKAKNESHLYELLREDITCKVSRKTGTITLSAIANDPAVAQQMVMMIYDQLAARIAAYRHEKAQRNVDYYAQLADNGPVSAAMYEMAQIRLESHQPEFIIVQHAEVPICKIAPKRATMVIIGLLLVTLCLVGFYWRKDIVEWL